MTRMTASDAHDNPGRDLTVAALLLAAAELVFAAALVGVALVVRAGDASQFDLAARVIVNDGGQLPVLSSAVLFGAAVAALPAFGWNARLKRVALFASSLGWILMSVLFVASTFDGTRRSVGLSPLPILCVAWTVPLCALAAVCGGLSLYSLRRRSAQAAAVSLGLLTAFGGLGLWALLLTTSAAPGMLFEPLPTHATE